MPDLIELKRVAVDGQLKRLMEARMEKGPSQDPDELRYSVLFYPSLQHLCEGLFNNPEKYVGLFNVAEVKELGATGLALAERYRVVQDRFHEAHAQVNRRTRVYQLYGPAPRERAEQGAAVLLRLRAAVADGVDGNDPKGAAIREGCGVGMTIRFDSPVDVQRALRMARVVLMDPEHAQVFEEACLPLAAFQRLVQEALAGLEAALLAGPGDASLQARANRAAAQLELECIAGMALAVVATALGREKRDELRALWPATTRKSMAAASTPQEVDGTVSTVNGSLVPVGNSNSNGNTTSTPLGREAGKTTEVPLLQPLFGTSVPKPMVAGGASNGANGTVTALLAAPGSNGVNGTANGASHP